MSKHTFFYGIYIIGIFSLFFYSFVQVDLGLTLTRASFWQDIQKWFQYIGYFNRPLSTHLYIGILALLFVGYIGIIQTFKTTTANIKLISFVLAITVVLLSFSYNAFSYDLFNYVFDAKIVTHYNQNPYEHKAFDFPGDPMLGFMHWTDRVYPYGPIWLGITIPISYLGLGYLLPTLILIKMLSAFSYVGISYFIYKICKKLELSDPLQRMLVFSLNPLVIIECLVSAHNDVVMMALAVMALYYYIDRRFVVASTLLILSIGIKFATVFLIPAIVLFIYLHWKKKSYAERTLVYGLLACMTVAVVAVAMRTNFQPWYLVYILPFLPLLPRTKIALLIGVVLAFFSLIQYIPFLYTGNWNPPIPTFLFWDTIFMAIIVGIIIFFSSWSLFGATRKR